MASTRSDAFAAAMQRLENRFDVMETKFDAKIDQLRDDIKGDLTEEIRQNAADIASNREDIEVLQTHVQQLENELDRSRKAEELVVKGVPVLSNENCNILYTKIAMAIGYQNDSAPVVETFRLGKRTNSAGRAPPILVKFRSRWEKSEFFGKYLRFRNLNLSHIGFTLNERVFISENLTKYDQLIFAEALQLRRAKKIQSVYVSSGAVFVRAKEGDRGALVKTVADLNIYKGPGTEN